MSYNLFLDDIRDPSDAGYSEDMEWVVVRNYKDFVDLISREGIPDIVSFDHDLADEHYSVGASITWDEYYSSDDREKTGYDCAAFLLGACIKENRDIPKCFIHSMNPVGRERINALLSSWKKYIGEALEKKEINQNMKELLNQCLHVLNIIPRQNVGGIDTYELAAKISKLSNDRI
jgi:hypothetical protein